MYRLEAVTGFYMVLTAMTSVRRDAVDALIQGRCRSEYRNLPSGVTHTACKGPNPRCTLDRALTGLSQQIKQQALQVHNDYRSQVAQGRLQNYPPAKNMYEFVWDDEIAEVAQAFAEQCDYSQHDENEARITSRFKYVGQCFGWAVDYARNNVTEGKTWADDWFGEYSDYNPNTVASFDISGATGVVTHFTQMIWAETRYIGCGYSNFQKDGQYARIFVCNYAPGMQRSIHQLPVNGIGREKPNQSPDTMYRLEATTGFFLVLTVIYLVRLDTLDALIQARCRPEYRNLPSGVTHTACKGPNPRCTLDSTLTGLSPQVKQQALQVHNDYRSQVAQGRLQHYQPAKNMYELEWDDEMAEVAQAFAEQCQHVSHDLPEARTTSRFKSVGQNFGWADDPVKQTVTEGKTWADDWFLEYRDYNPNAVASFDSRSSRAATRAESPYTYLGEPAPSVRRGAPATQPQAFV
ncbi:hypothetical protein HPB49_011972 [Dermacentor silvarum]|uniref:Uncharacterized protein n=1 Tax=Dermacentor silvarum TaxID=543639 RepID=A0ACB8CXC9_DERSI|nr:hypothetical protein HPB49_011972 [Dermacentor silvarum]